MNRLRAVLNDPGHVFTEKEGRVLELICEGRLRKQMADELHRSTKTLENHIDQIHKKLGTHRPGETVATAVARGLVRISQLCLVYAICLQATSLDMQARRPPARTVRVVRIREVGA